MDLPAPGIPVMAMISIALSPPAVPRGVISMVPSSGPINVRRDRKEETKKGRERKGNARLALGAYDS